jgi:hypothetical protein
MAHEIWLAFRIMEFPDHPDQITSLIGVQPTKTWRVGEPRIPGTSLPLREQNGWELSSGLTHEVTDPLEGFQRHIDSILEKIEPNLARFEAICNRHYSELSCALYLKHDSTDSIPSIHLDRRAMQIFGRLGTEVDLDLYIG